MVPEVAVPPAARAALTPLPPSRSRGAEPYPPRHARASKRTRGASRAPPKRLLVINEASLWDGPAEAPDAYLAVIALHVVVFVH